MTSTLPTPGDALQTSIDLYNDGRMEEARYWLDVARELRQGQRRPQLMATGGILSAAPAGRESSAPITAEHIAEMAETMRIPGYLDADATAVVAAVQDGKCPACNAETITVAGGRVHRSTYSAECEYAAV